MVRKSWPRALQRTSIIDPASSVGEGLAVGAIEQRLDRGSASVGHVLVASFVAGVIAWIAFAGFVFFAEWAQRRGPPGFPGHLLLFAHLLGVAALIVITPVHMFAMRVIVPFGWSLARFS